MNQPSSIARSTNSGKPIIKSSWAKSSSSGNSAPINKSPSRWPGHGIPFVCVTPKLADPKAVAKLPFDFLRRNCVLPMFCVEGMLTVALPEPENLFLIEEIERRSGLRVQIVAATARDILATLEAYLPADCAFVVDDALADLHPQSLRLTEAPGAKAARLPEVDPPVIKLTNYCIYIAIRQRAAEIHIEPGETDLRIRFRIDGRLVHRLRPPRRMHAPLVARLKALAGMNSSSDRTSVDGQMRDCRRAFLQPVPFVNRKPRRRKAGSANRRGRPRPLKLEKLGFSYDMLKQWRKLLTCSAGLIIICGPAGSGKRSVLYSSLMERNTEDSNLCTVEDRLDQALTGINQFPIDPAAGMDFAATLRAVMRQEPDLLMLSDLADLETARLATQAALSGKLVLAAMHAADPVSAISRLMHLGLEPHLLGSTIQGVLSRRLVRRLCPNCKAAYEPTSAQKRQLDLRGVGLTTLYRARGCERCHNLGFAGQIGIHELLIPDDTLRKRSAPAPASPTSAPPPDSAATNP